jgi:formamidopyrimidine-DNA glycosylase
MPELPEVETVRRTLQRLVAGKTIRQVEVRLPRIIRRPAEPEAFARALQGLTIRTVGRRGKFLKFDLDELLLISHLRMEGRYGLYEAGAEVENHTHVIFSFTDGTELRYRDVRQFGTMDLYKPGEEQMIGPLVKLGLEPLDEAFTELAFRASLAGRSTKIKPLLLGQECVVGLGNIYVDEALFASGIHPERPADTLSRKELTGLYEAIVKTLSDAVEAGGSSVKSYVNGQGEQGAYQFMLKAYGREGMPCSHCGDTIVKFVVGGRGTHICPCCQPLKKIRKRAAHSNRSTPGR